MHTDVGELLAQNMSMLPTDEVEWYVKSTDSGKLGWLFGNLSDKSVGHL